MTTGVQIPALVLVINPTAYTHVIHRSDCGHLARIGRRRAGVTPQCVASYLTPEQLRLVLRDLPVRPHHCLNAFLRALPAPPAPLAEPVT